MDLIPLVVSFRVCCCLGEVFLAKLLFVNKLSESDVISNLVLPFSGGELPQTALITGYVFS